MKKINKITIELTKKELSDILLEKFREEYPDANLDCVNYDIVNDPLDYDTRGPSRKILGGVEITGSKEIKEWKK